MANEKQLLIEALKKSHDVRFTPGVYEHSIYGKAALLLEKSEEVVHGRWREKILVGGFAEEWCYVCSECGCTVSDRSNLGIGRYASKNQRLNYCPNCGAKMDGDGG